MTEGYIWNWVVVFLFYFFVSMSNITDINNYLSTGLFLVCSEVAQISCCCCYAVCGMIVFWQPGATVKVWSVAQHLAELTSS